MSLELGVEVCWLRSLGRLRYGAECFLGHTLVFSHQADVAPQFAVTESGYSHQAKGAQKQATKEPSHTAMSFVVSNDSGKEGARYPEKGKRNHRQPKHHQSVVATQR